MPRGRETEIEQERVRSMETGPTLKEGQRGSGPQNFEKEGFHGPAKKKTPRTATSPSD